MSRFSPKLALELRSLAYRDVVHASIKAQYCEKPISCFIISIIYVCREFQGGKRFGTQCLRSHKIQSERCNQIFVLARNNFNKVFARLRCENNLICGTGFLLPGFSERKLCVWEFNIWEDCVIRFNYWTKVTSEEIKEKKNESILKYNSSTINPGTT